MLLNILYVSIIVFYSFTVLSYFIDFIQNNQKVKRIAFWLLSIVWILQFIFLVFRTIEYNRLPMMTIFESMFIYSWILVTLSLIISRLFKVDFWILFVNLVGFVILTISIFAPTGDISPMLSELLILELLIIHVTFLLLSYGSFTLSFAFSFLYFLQHHMLKQKKWGKRMIRLGDLSKLEKLAYFFVLFGLPFMLLGIMLGIVWAWVTFDTVPWYDMKVISSFIVVLVYSAYLFRWVVTKRRGYHLALFNIAAFLVLIINYFLSGSYSSFHIW